MAGGGVAGGDLAKGRLFGTDRLREKAARSVDAAAARFALAACPGIRLDGRCRSMDRKIGSL